MECYVLVIRNALPSDLSTGKSDGKPNLNSKCAALSPHFQEHSSLSPILLSLLSPLQLPQATPPATLRQRCPPPFSSKVCLKSRVSCIVASNEIALFVFATVERAVVAAPSVIRVVSLLRRPVRSLPLPELEAASFSICHFASSVVALSSSSASRCRRFQTCSPPAPFLPAFS
ncbi:uncharacterized protein LOC110263231 isoform X2 [Arachis ipaensis]|uniref:uncharacterized protein LOC110263231 isoform X2 n=1 Tax=Arachis ipaensis TaxID=130454 RepID=UPI000A2B7351|nr:uncharacterized protein LOC110263231 isoform X2 [Arachis ipaensis]XP_025663130.1 uncharacterized protein LOC112758633 isoform X2 [Arachis hypogaea]